MKRRLKLIAINIAVLLLLLIIVEGGASYFLLFYDLATKTPTAERRHTRYDPELGWSHIPNIDVRDMYGPGVYLRTNSQGFRNNRDFGAKIPKGKRRVICAGDSFTLGYGVDNDHTWCQRLTALDPRLETVNMGQGGYGVDQVYLWFKRDSGKLEHNVSLVAFITLDFFRMQSNRFAGYGKPVLKVEDGRLVTRNVPVPVPFYGFTWLLARRHHIGKLRTAEFVSRALPKDPSSKNRANRTSRDRNEETRKVLAKLFEEIKALDKARSSKLILVYLPYQWDLENNSAEEWTTFVRQTSRDLDIPLIDVLSEFRAMPDKQAANLFIPKGTLKYPGAAGHLNDQGNEVVARMIYKELKSHLPPTQ